VSAVIPEDEDMSLRGRSTLLAAALLAAAPALAQPYPPEQLPPPLRDWTRWVLDGVPGAGCVTVGEETVCAWPGRLQLDLAETGGRFQLDVATDREADVPLPGDAQRWPLAVTAGGRALPVLEKAELPWVRLPPGTHHLEGRFAWPRLPDVLTVPASVALVDVSIGGRAVPSPRRLAARGGRGPGPDRRDAAPAALPQDHGRHPAAGRDRAADGGVR
jgi:hypothetical protein